MSPSNDEPLGVIRRNSAALAARASCVSVFGERATFAATAASVVLRAARSSNLPSDRMSPEASTRGVSANPPLCRRAPAMISPRASRTSPNAFTTTIAPTVRSFDTVDSTEQPNPPFMHHAGPPTFPTVVPVPAPIDPSATFSLRAVSVAA